MAHVRQTAPFAGLQADRLISERAFLQEALAHQEPQIAVDGPRLREGICPPGLLVHPLGGRVVPALFSTTSGISRR